MISLQLQLNKVYSMLLQPDILILWAPRADSSSVQ